MSMKKKISTRQYFRGQRRKYGEEDFQSVERGKERNKEDLGKPLKEEEKRERHRGGEKGKIRPTVPRRRETRPSHAACA